MKREKTRTEILKNNIYAVKLAFSLSKSRVIHSFLTQLISQLMWVFYSAYFVRFVINVIQDELPIHQIIINISVIGGITLMLEIYRYYYNNAIFPMQNVKLYHGIYKKIYKKSENVELKCYEDSKFYDAFSVSLDGIGNKISEITDNLGRIIAGITGSLLASWVMITIDKWTILFLAAPLIGNFIIAPRVNKINQKRYLDGVPFDRVMGYINRVMYLPEYAKEIRLSKIHNVLFDKYNSATQGRSSIWKKYFTRAFILGCIQYLFSFTLIFEGIFIYGTYRAIVPQTNMISFEQMAVLTGVMITASWGWLGVLNAINRSSEDSLLITNLRDFLEYKEKIPEDYDGIMPDKDITEIEFKNVSFSYDGNINVINNMSFCVKKGQNLALVGHNGAGKSTLVKLLMRLYDPSEGSIYVNGRDIREYNLLEYRKLFSCAFQDIKIFSGSIRENVLMGRNGTDEDVAEALKSAGIYEKIIEFPKGIDTILTKEFDDDGALLSGGEFQKIIVARALAFKTPIAVFDEPSSALDPIAESELFSSILKSTGDGIGIFISHRLSCVKNADIILMCENGEILENGTHDDLMKENKSYADMYKTQERNYFAHDGIDENGEVNI
jgi:ATP-binding cassette subfamily B protein